MGRKSRIFFVDDDEQLHRIPQARYQRILDRTEAVYLYAGKTIRFIHVVVEVGISHQPKVVTKEFGRYSFDATGLLARDRKMKQLLGAAKVLEVSQESDWADPYRCEYIEPHCWEPSKAILEQLRTIFEAENCSGW